MMRIAGRGLLRRSTPTCAPRAARARWSARSTATWPTTSGGPRPGSSRRCSRRARSRATPTWARPTPRPSRRWCGAAAGRPDFVGDVQAMRRRVEENVRPDHADREIKLGPGGLRDVEFAVQLLQLVHGRADEALRSPLDARRAAGPRERRLRRPRRRREPRRLLPVPAPAGAPAAAAAAAPHPPAPRRGRHGRAALARPRRRSCGPTGGTTPSASSSAEWRRNARRVRRLHEKLFYRPLLTRCPGCPTEASRLSEAGRPPGSARWAGCRPRARCAHLRALTGGVSRAAAIQQALLPVLLDELARTPDPDRGLLAYRRVSEALGPHPVVPAAAARTRVWSPSGSCGCWARRRWFRTCSCARPRCCGCSPRRSRASADELIRDPADVRRVAAAAVGAPARPATPPRRTARSPRRHEMLRDRVRGPARHAVRRAGVRALSAVVGRRCSAATLASVLRALGGRDGPPARLAVIGMGRLGGGRAGLRQRRRRAVRLRAARRRRRSRRPPATPTTVAETVRRQPRPREPGPGPGRRRRPAPRRAGHGPLVRTLESYRAYYARWSQVWEAQALLRARPGGGRRRARARGSSS